MSTNPNVKKSQHTPEPWRTLLEDPTQVRSVAGSFIGSFLRKEDARLAVASPALLSVAKKFIEGCERGEHVGEVFFSQLLDEARAAVEIAEPDTVRIMAHADMAKDLIARTKQPMPALVTETNFAGEVTRGWFGFVFDPSGAVKVGDLLKNSDGTVAHVRAIVPGYKAP